MTTVKVFAPAKVNLTLHITGQRDDGYHLIDSLVVFTSDVGDRVSVASSDSLSLSLTGSFVDGVPVDDSNLVMKAAHLIRDVRGVSFGAEISIEKNLPNGAGIGGGSSDAAAAIKALSQLWGVAPLSAAEALPLGADLPVCLNAPKASIMRGVGDLVEDATPLPDFWLVLVNPGIAIPTAEVFQRLGQKFSTDNPPMEPMPEVSSFLDFDLWLCGTRNDLTMCMYDFRMDVLECIWALRRLPECWKTNMSGSGSTCWGLFENQEAARLAVRQLEADHPEWWIKATAIS